MVRKKSVKLKLIQNNTDVEISVKDNKNYYNSIPYVSKVK